jgi:hypothetical protein
MTLPRRGGLDGLSVVLPAASIPPGWRPSGCRIRALAGSRSVADSVRRASRATPPASLYGQLAARPLVTMSHRLPDLAHLSPLTGEKQPRVPVARAKHFRHLPGPLNSRENKQQFRQPSRHAVDQNGHLAPSTPCRSTCTGHITITAVTTCATLPGANSMPPR